VAGSLGFPSVPSPKLITGTSFLQDLSL